MPAPDPEAANLIRSSLVRLGLPTPAVTPDMIKDEEEYHEELARELGGLLLGLSPSTSGLMGNGRVLGKGKARETLPVLPESGRGLVGLDEVWCVWNRARGVGECSQGLPLSKRNADAPLSATSPRSAASPTLRSRVPAASHVTSYQCPHVPFWPGGTPHPAVRR